MDLIFVKINQLYVGMKIYMKKPETLKSLIFNEQINGKPIPHLGYFLHF